MSIQFITDQEFDLSNSDNQDLLGTKPYADTLFEIIKKSDGKQNIGLFGGWGSGKSTIIRTLEVLITKRNQECNKDRIAFYKYDAWKYSNDDFRRSFIKEINSKFDIIPDNFLNQKLYNEVTTEDNNKERFSVNYPHVILLLISAIILILIIGVYVLPKIKNDDTKSVLVLISLIGSFLFFLSRGGFRTIPFHVKQTQLIEPERFQETFQTIIQGIFGKKLSFVEKAKRAFYSKLDYHKVVIVIDNLDRCDNNNLKETLITMKNFLESENVIFILPVDENGITSFLNSDSEDAEEYLRKIFHQIVRLKKFTPKELVEYTKELNKKENLKLSNIGVRLICQEFTTNPRKIIQFLNNLQTERELIKRQIDAKLIDLTYDSQADDFMIKLLIIRQEWNSIYKSILDDVNFLNKMNRALKSKVDQLQDRFTVKIDSRDYDLTRDQKRFFKRNINVHYSNVEPFILNIDRDKDVPDELRAHIENGEVDEIFDLLFEDRENNFESETVALLLNQIEICYDYNSNKFEDYASIALPISEILFDLLNYDSFKTEIKKNFNGYSFINRIFSSHNFNSVVFDLSNFRAYCFSAKWFSTELDYTKPYTELVAHINYVTKRGNNRTGHAETTRIFVETYSDRMELRNELSNNLSQKILDEPELLKSYGFLLDSLRIANILLGSQFIEQMLKLIDQDRIDDEETISALLEFAEKYIEGEYMKDGKEIAFLANYYLKKVKAEYEIHHASTDDILNLEEIFKKLNKVLPKSSLKELKIDETLLSQINRKLDSLSTVTSLSKEKINFYLSFLNLVSTYMKINSAFASNANVQMYFNTAFSKNYDKLSLGINDIYYELVSYYSPHKWNFTEPLLNKLNNSTESPYLKTLMLIYKKGKNKKHLSEAQKSSLIDGVIRCFLMYDNGNALHSSGIWLQDIYLLDQDLYMDKVQELSENDLEKYVYKLYRLENDRLIGNSFSIYLKSLIHYKSFEKFVRFVGYKHSSKTQNELIKGLYENDYSNFDWLFSARKSINKKTLTGMILQYIELYSGSHQNTAYLKNLLKLSKSEIPPSAIKKISEFLSLIKKPTKSQLEKIKDLRKQLSL